MKQQLLLSVTVMLVAGCVGARADEPGAASPSSASAVVDSPTIGQLMQSSRGSLYQASLQVTPDPRRTRNLSASLFAVTPPEPKQLKKHDLITIIIREETDITSDGKTNLTKQSDVNAHLDQFVKLHPSNWMIKGGAQGATPPAVQWGLNRDFQAEGKYERSDKFNSRLEAEVVDVKPNGTVVVQAQKAIKHDDEEQEFVLTGVCRGTDLTPDNSVFSWQLHNLRVTTMTNGAVTATQDRGAITKLLDVINPF
jgi:flagellar L-ring protein precursor FlgH